MLVKVNEALVWEDSGNSTYVLVNPCEVAEGWVAHPGLGLPIGKAGEEA